MRAAEADTRSALVTETYAAPPATVSASTTMLPAAFVFAAQTFRSRLWHLSRRGTSTRFVSHAVWVSDEEATSASSAVYARCGGYLRTWRRAFFPASASVDMNGALFSSLHAEEVPLAGRTPD